eukprot:297936-Pelagomonas_calceolata.AAC.1
MPCPFGFRAGADEGADASGEEEEEPDIPENGPVFCAGEVADGQAGADDEEKHPIKKKSKKKGGNAETKVRVCLLGTYSLQVVCRSRASILVCVSEFTPRNWCLVN